jgi:hypothetical protein
MNFIMKPHWVETEWPWLVDLIDIQGGMTTVPHTKPGLLIATCMCVAVAWDASCCALLARLALFFRPGSSHRDHEGGGWRGSLGLVGQCQLVVTTWRYIDGLR